MREKMLIMNIILLKHGKKYSAADVNRQALSLRKYTNEKIYCFTEDPTDVVIDCIEIPRKPKLVRWWNKMNLFRDDFALSGKCVLFDLDIEIKKNPFPYIEDIDWNTPTFLRDFWKKDLYYTPHSYETELNSSVLAWTTGENGNVWKLFSSNIDYYTRKYMGVDRFFWNENIEWNTFDNRINTTITL